MVEWSFIITVAGLSVIGHFIVENQVLDPLLFLSVCLLLAPHGYGKAGIRW